MPPLAQMACEHAREIGVPFRREDRERVPEEPDDEARDPLLEPEAERRGGRAVDDRQRARGTAQKDRLDQRAVDRRLEAEDMLARAHPISAPPPKLKNDRKKEEAAKAIERPKTIWMSRRNPPAVSPKARVRPVVMMMITATIFATGPWTDSSTCWSGCSQGMPEPAACAGPAMSSAAAAAAVRKRQA